MMKCCIIIENCSDSVKFKFVFRNKNKKTSQFDVHCVISFVKACAFDHNFLKGKPPKSSMTSAMAEYKSVPVQ